MDEGAWFAEYPGLKGVEPNGAAFNVGVVEQASVDHHLIEFSERFCSIKGLKVGGVFKRQVGHGVSFGVF